MWGTTPFLLRSQTYAASQVGVVSGISPERAEAAARLARPGPSNGGGLHHVTITALAPPPDRLGITYRDGGI